MNQNNFYIIPASFSCLPIIFELNHKHTQALVEYTHIKIYVNNKVLKWDMVSVLTEFPVTM